MICGGDATRETDDKTCTRKGTYQSFKVKQKRISNIPQSKNPANVTAINVMSGIYLRCDMLLGLLGMTSRAVNPRDIVVEMVDHKGG